MTSDRDDEALRHALKRHLASVVATYREELGHDAPEALRRDLGELLGAADAAAAIAAALAAPLGVTAADDDAAACARFPKIIGRSPKMLDVYRPILKIAPTGATGL